MIAYTGCALLLIALLSWFFIWQVVGRPVKALERGTHRLAAGDLGYQIDVHSNDEIGELAHSFNVMSRQLQAEHNENVAWTHTLEQRVEHKTSELKRAHEHALHTEKMASIGKMAAVLAHEINNPLSGILTYAKLVRKWTDRQEMPRDDGGRARRQEISDSLDLIASREPALRRLGEESAHFLPHHANQFTACQSQPGRRPIAAPGPAPTRSRGHSSAAAARSRSAARRLRRCANRAGASSRWS